MCSGHLLHASPPNFVTKAKARARKSIPGDTGWERDAIGGPERRDDVSDEVALPGVNLVGRAGPGLSVS